MARPKRSGSMGPCFAKMLTAYEECERAVSAVADERFDQLHINADKLGGAMPMLMADAGTEFGEMSESKNIGELLHRWASDAKQLRSAFKFKMTYADMLTLADFDNPDLVMKIPFEECVLVVNMIDEHKIGNMCLFIEERYYTPQPDEKMPDWYRDVGINYGDKFLCVTASFITAGGRFVLLPAEYHATNERPMGGDNAGTWCTAVPPGTSDKTLETMESFGTLVFVMLGGWVAAINNPNRKETQTAGLKPGVKHHAPRHKERRFYEHKLVTIDPLAERCDSDATGHGGKHRLHPVRGFWRTYKKSGKRVWVRPHWRGDKDLGVITHDYEVIHEQD